MNFHFRYEKFYPKNSTLQLLLTASDGISHMLSSIEVMFEHRLRRNWRHITVNGKHDPVLFWFHVKSGALCVTMETPVLAVPSCSRCNCCKLNKISIFLLILMIIFEIIKFILYLKFLNQKWLHKKFEQTVPSEKESSRKVIEKGLTYTCKVTIKNY